MATIFTKSSSGQVNDDVKGFKTVIMAAFEEKSIFCEYH